MMKRLDVLVVEQLGCSRSRAREMILKGRVSVNGARTLKPGRMFTEEDMIFIEDLEDFRFVGRGGCKLEKGLAFFKISPEGKICLDIGASTGGFTQCLLEAGAARVYAIDCGRDQLHPSLRMHPRVISMEGVNVRGLLPDQVEEVDLAVIDVSFISLTKVLRPVSACVHPHGDMICLIKPQFEAGRQHLNRKGIVKDPKVHESVIRHLVAWSVQEGFTPRMLTCSPVRGGEGNLEYLMYLINTPCDLSPSQFDPLIRRTVQEAKAV